MSIQLQPENNYVSLLADIKLQVRNAQTRAILAVNSELLQLYWHVGCLIETRQVEEGWGSSVITRLSQDLQNDLPGIKGFSTRNIDRMLSFYREYPSLIIDMDSSVRIDEFSPQLVAKIPNELILSIPWGHHGELITRIKDIPTRQWYMESAVKNGWSRNVLVMQIEVAAHERLGHATSNFALRLPPPDSDMAQQTLKDPYIFDFLTLDTDFRERELEAGLIAHLERFLLELGQGFAFVGRQYHLDIGDQDFYIDLLFYHLSLRCFVVIDLKRGDFKPEYAGKINFYCNVVDDRLRHEGDKPTIGLILCQ